MTEKFLVAHDELPPLSSEFVWVVCSDKYCAVNQKKFFFFTFRQKHYHKAPAVLKFGVSDTTKTSDKFGKL